MSWLIELSRERDPSVLTLVALDVVENSRPSLSGSHLVSEREI